jgi:outer membrane protein
MLKRCLVVCLIVVCMLALPIFGQTPEISTSSGGWFSGLTKDYRPRPVPAVNFDDSQRMEKLTRAGMIYLSLRDAIALALENNLDIEYARYNPRLSDANLLRATAGQLLRNVGTSVNQGPSSATLGVLAGANQLGSTGTSTSGGQGGVLSGLNVQLAGTAIPNLDPVLTGFWQFNHTTSPQSSSFVTLTNSLTSQYQNAIFGIQKGYLTGTTVNLGLTNTIGFRQNSPNSDFNPYTSATLQLQITQNLLQGFGIAVNNRAIRVARNQRRGSDLTFQQQVITTVANVVTLYWDLVSFNDSLRIKRQALEVNQTLYEENKRRAELGALAPIDVIQTEAEMKAAQQDVTTQESQVLQQEMILKSVLTRDGLSNPAIALAHITPTDHIEVPAQEPIVPIQDLIGEALANRPEVEQSRIGLEDARVNTLGTKNALLPTLQAFVNMANNGQAGSVNTLPVPVTINGTTTYVTRNPANVNQFFLGGYGTVLSQLFARNFPNYAVGLQLSIPLRNRAAQADLVTDELNYRQSQIQDKQLANNIRINVMNNYIALSQARSAYDTSVVARQLQDQTLAGQRRRFELGAVALLDVMIAQRDDTTRHLSEASALNQYVHARVNLEQVTGRVLKDYEVDLQDAVSGVSRREPDLIPPVDKLQK